MPALNQIKAAALWVIGLAIAVIGVLQTTSVVTGSKPVGAVLAVAGSLLPVLEHYIASGQPLPATLEAPADTTASKTPSTPKTTGSPKNK